ncbi:apolipoprotein N-acyltransferase [bacterium]|nr:apolipoprotein N-acyltransferase [bacterium]
MKQLLIQIALIIVAATLMIVSFPVGETLSGYLPDLPWEFCVFCALIPMFIVLRGHSNGTAFRFGYLFGFLYYYGIMSWIVITMLNYGNMSATLCYLILIALVCYLAFYGSFFFLFNRLLTERLGLPHTLVAPFVWVLLEYIRTYMISGFPWNLLGYTLYRQPLLIQIADLVGVYGLSFLIVIVNCLIFDLFFGEWARRTKIIVFALVLALVLMTVGYGQFRLHDNQEADEVKVCLIQGNYRQEEKWAPHMKQTTLETYLNLSRACLSASPDLIVWPEAAVPFRLRYSPSSFAKIAQLACECDCQLLLGSPDMDESPEGNTQFYNAAFLIDNRGEFLDRYDKIHLVPFGEYVPLKKLLFFVEKMTEGATGDFSAGSKYTVFKGTLPPFSLYICYETIFPDLVRKFAKSGARFLVSITNDAWFGRSAASYQHFAMTVFRAIENRCPVVRAANTGITGIIDQKGQILEQTEIFTRTSLCGTIRIRPEHLITVYTRWGDFFVAFCAGVVVLLAGIALILPGYSKSAQMK